MDRDRGVSTNLCTEHRVREIIGYIRDTGTGTGTGIGGSPLYRAPCEGNRVRAVSRMVAALAGLPNPASTKPSDGRC